VINLLVSIAGRYGYADGKVGNLIYMNGGIKFSDINKENSDLMVLQFSECIKLLESKPENIQFISSANKMDCFSEQKVPDELQDACVLAQKECVPVLTDDYLYLEMNTIETKKKRPGYFSTFALMKVMYEYKIITFNEYLDFFEYLSFYRYRFLDISLDDLEKAVMGDNLIKAILPNNIRKFNYSLTLSKEYGVPFQMAFSLVGNFVSKIVLDNSISSDIAEKVFIEILESFPVDMDKYEFGQLLLRACYNYAEKAKSQLFINTSNPIYYKKYEKLLRVNEIYKSSKILEI